MKSLICLFLTILCALQLQGQAVAINDDNSAPASSSILDVKSTNKGMLVPRMSSSQRIGISAPATGLLVYDTDVSAFWYFNGTGWVKISQQAVLSDTDNDTKVQVEETPDEDIIRFDLAGVESMVLLKNVNGWPRLELGEFNTFIGKNTGLSNANVWNSAFGVQSLYTNNTGYSNTSIGAYALYSNSAGFANTAIGHNALYSNGATNENTAVGVNALFNNSGSRNTGVGRDALSLNYTGSNNTALGSGANVTSGSLSNATAIGYNALVASSNCVVLGGSGADAVRVGIGTSSPATSAILEMQSFDKGILIPRLNSSQRTGIVSPATGLLVYDVNFNAFWFYNGMDWIRLSPQSVIADADSDTRIQVEESIDEDMIRFDLAGIERMVLRKNATGWPRLELLGGGLNTFVGESASQANISGTSNTAIGAESLYTNTSGSANTAIGHNALRTNTSSQNTATGKDALFYNNSGSENTATGVYALFNNTSGSFNTAFGKDCLSGNVSGNNNTAIGYFATVGAENLINATAIGNGAIVSSSNKVRVGNGSVMVIEGNVDWSFVSDARFKFNIQTHNVPGLDFISKLQPVTYQFDTRKFDAHVMQNLSESQRLQRMAGHDYAASSAIHRTGFLAQDVEQICRELRIEFSGLHVPVSKEDNYSIAYGSFIPIIVKGMQEQQGQIRAQLQQIVMQNEQIAALQYNYNVLLREHHSIEDRLSALENGYQDR